MKTIAISLFGIFLIHGGASAQTTEEQDRILRLFQEKVTTLAAAQPGPVVFTLPEATVFRQLIARTLDEQTHISHMTGVGPGLPLDHHPAPLEPFPAAELHEFPAVLARALPALPHRLEYRLIGNDLVLRDAEGNVIVAVLRDAVGHVAAVRR